MDGLCDNIDYTCGDFLFLEIVRTDNKTLLLVILIDPLATLSTLRTMSIILKKKLNLLDKHKNKIIVFLGDTN